MLKWQLNCEIWTNETHTGDDFKAKCKITRCQVSYWYNSWSTTRVRLLSRVCFGCWLMAVLWVQNPRSHSPRVRGRQAGTTHDPVTQLLLRLSVPGGGGGGGGGTHSVRVSKDMPPFRPPYFNSGVKIHPTDTQGRLGWKFTPRILRLGWKFTTQTPHPYPFWGEVTTKFFT